MKNFLIFIFALTTSAAMAAANYGMKCQNDVTSGKDKGSILCPITHTVRTGDTIFMRQTDTSKSFQMTAFNIRRDASTVAQNPDSIICSITTKALDGDVGTIHVGFLDSANGKKWYSGTESIDTARLLPSSITWRTTWDYPSVFTIPYYTVSSATDTDGVYFGGCKSK